jgi:hypothetical protein
MLSNVEAPRHAEEHKPLACSSRQLAANMNRKRRLVVPVAFGKLPNAAGWQPALPNPRSACLRAPAFLQEFA